MTNSAHRTFSFSDAVDSTFRHLQYRFQPRLLPEIPGTPPPDEHKQELQQLSDKYRSLPATRRGPEEITVAGPELAAAATRAAEAAAAAVTAAASATASGDVTAVPTEGSATGGVVGDVGDEDRRGRGGEREAAVKAAAEQAAAAAAGRLLVAEIPALASMLHQQMGVPKERVKRLLLKWPRLLEVRVGIAGTIQDWCFLCGSTWYKRVRSTLDFLWLFPPNCWHGVLAPKTFLFSFQSGGGPFAVRAGGRLLKLDVFCNLTTISGMVRDVSGRRPG